VVITPASFIVTYPQFLNPNPTVVSNPRFRRALMYAMDRQEMVESLQGGLTSVAHSFLALDEPEYRDVEASIVRYTYDPARAAQMVEALGYTKGLDGGFRDPSNARLAIELRSLTGIDINQKAQLSAADYWQRLGLAVEQVIVPRARAQDREYIATFPSFQVNRQGSTVSFLTNRRSSSAPSAETNFVGQNYARYMDPAFDALIDRFFVTIPWQDRMQVLRQIMHQMTDEVHAMGLFFDGTPTLMAKRIERVTPRQQGWNAHEWDAR
jgi:ABC-type transport system substrate-binding protein